MVEKFQMRERQDIQAHPRRPALWVWLIGAALVFVVVGVGYAVWTSKADMTAANPPAVLATPSAAPQVQPPARETTAGNPVQTTGQKPSQKP